MSQPGLGEGNAGDWVTVNRERGDAMWAGYGDHGPSDVAVDSSVTHDRGNYNPADDAGRILDGTVSFAGPMSLNGPSVPVAVGSSAEYLHWFHLVQARYALTGRPVPADVPALKSENEIDRLYHQQSDMQLDHLFGAGQRIAAALPKIEQAHGDHHQATSRLAGCWQGPNGAAVHDKLSKLGTWSDDVLDELKPLPDIIFSTVDEIKRCLKRKADAFAQMQNIRSINGVDMTNGASNGKAINTRDDANAALGNDDVSLILSYAARRGVGDMVRARIEGLANSGVFGPNPGLPHYKKNTSTNNSGGGTGASATVTDHTEFDDKAMRLCEIWRNQFCESAEGYFRAYSNLCTETDKAVQGYLQVVTDALNGIGHIAKPPVPAQDPGIQPSGPGPSPSGPAATHTAGVDSAAQPPPAAPGPPPPPTTPASAQSNPLQMLSGLAGQAGQAVQQGLGQLQGMAQQGPGGLGMNPAGLGAAPTDAGVPPGSKPLANVPFPGGNLALAQAPDGSLSAAVTGPDGKTQRYSMGVKDGKPYFTPEGPAQSAASEQGGPDDKSANGVESTAGVSGAGGTAGSGGTTGGAGGAPPSMPPLGASAQHQPHVAAPDGAPATAAAGADASAASMAAGSPMGGMPMGGMPMGGGGGAKPPDDNDRRSSGIVPPQQLWGDTAGRDGPAIEAPFGPDTWDDDPPMGYMDLDHAPAEPPVPPPATPRSPAPAPPPPRTDGVKIEIDMGDAK